MHEDTFFSKGRYILKRHLYPSHHPDFIIIGAQKAGTSSLHYFLAQHPHLLGSTPKEVCYFNRDENFAKGKNWYCRSFVDLSRQKKDFLCFEATPEYSYQPWAAQRMHAQYPNLKLIMILRDPVKRAYSAWNMFREMRAYKKPPAVLRSGYLRHRDNNLTKELFKPERFPTFEEVVNADMEKIKTHSDFVEPSFVRRGLYLPQIKRFHNLFGKDKLLLLGTEELRQHPIETLNKTLVFLGLQKSEWNFLDRQQKNVRPYKDKMSREMKERLEEFYSPHNTALFNYLGTKINW